MLSGTFYGKYIKYKTHEPVLFITTIIILSYSGHTVNLIALYLY